MNSNTLTNSKNNISIIIIPPIRDAKYLRFLYKAMLRKSSDPQRNFNLYSPQLNSKKARKFLYLIEILFLIFRKTCLKEKIILHIHWLEFLYFWGKYKYIIPFLTASILFYIGLFKRFSRNKVAITVHNILPHKINWYYIEYIFFRIMLKKWVIAFLYILPHIKNY